MGLEQKRVAFIGGGVMGEAMIKGLLATKTLQTTQIIVSDPHGERAQELKQLYAIETTTDNLEAIANADMLILCVKPQVMDKVLAQLRGKVDRCSLILSIVAGVTIEHISEHLLNGRVVRAMPNTPAQIGQGITVWTASEAVHESQYADIRATLTAMGEEMFVEEERFLNMATALSGTGPAYIFLFMEALIDAGVHMGFSRRDAERLVLQTMRGSVDYARESKLHPAQLRNQVTSPGGTSAEAIYQMERGGLRTVISRAVYAAYQRARVLGGEDDKKGL